MIFVFVSSKDREVLGFTADQTGGNLPSGYAPWEPATGGGAVLVGSDDADPVTEAVRRDGFFLAVGGYEDEGRGASSVH
jgi:hypothetical protein